MKLVADVEYSLDTGFKLISVKGSADIYFNLGTNWVLDSSLTDKTGSFTALQGMKIKFSGSGEVEII